MGKDANLHQGHRARMMDKFLENPSSLNDHQLLEVLLFGIIPRVDTNPTAHRLLNTFGNLSKIFSASPKELMSVEGVGRSVATAITAMGKILDKVIEQRKTDKKESRFSFRDNKDQIIADFKGIYHERVILYLLDSKFVRITSIIIEEKDKYSVNLEVGDIAKAFAIHKPKYVILAHNHPSGMAEPSKEDDLTTQKITLLCNVHGANLVDHVLVAGKNAFSYRLNGRIYGLQEKADIEKLLR